MAIKTNSAGIITHNIEAFSERGRSFGLASLRGQPSGMRKGVVSSAPAFTNAKSARVNTQTLYISNSNADYIADNSTSWTWCGWFKSSVGNKYIGSIVSHGSTYFPGTGTARGVLFFIQNTNKVEVRFYRSGISYFYDGGASVVWPLDAWFFLALSADYNTDKLIIYCNGNSKTLTVSSAIYPGISLSDSSRDLTYGGFDPNYSIHGINGNVDEPAIYGAALSVAELDEIYNGGVPTDLSSLSTASNLKGWWRCGDDGSDTSSSFVAYAGPNNLTGQAGITIVEDVP